LFWRSVAPAQMQAARINRHIHKECLRMLILFLRRNAANSIMRHVDIVCLGAGHLKCVAANQIAYNKHA
jgi:hypothetical protein